MIEFWPQILCFTLLLALTSASVACFLGAVLGRWCAKVQPGPWLGVLRGIAQVTFVMPAMVPALAFVIAVPGWFGFWPLVSVLVFINLPYCVIQVQEALELQIKPAHRQHWGLLRLSFFQRLWFGEWPYLRSTIKTTFLVVMAACLSSFSVVLFLGGGPATTTLSVALYHAIAVGYHPQEFLLFALLQMGVMVPLGWVLTKGQTLGMPRAEGGGHQRPTSLGRSSAGSFVIGGMGLLIYAAPLWVLGDEALATGTQMASGFVFLVLHSALITLLLGLGVSILTFALAFWILGHVLLTKSRIPTPCITGLALWSALPKIVLVSGVFLGMQGWVDPEPIRQWLSIGVVSGLCLLPYVLQTLMADVAFLQGRYHGAMALHRFGYGDLLRTIILPHLGPKLRTQGAIVMGFAMGNLSIPLILGQGEVRTLPVLSYQYLTHYAQAEAAFGLLILVAMIGAIFWIGRGE